MEWRWSDSQPDGTLVLDAKLGTWQMPWNAKPDAGRLAIGIALPTFWASDPIGVNEVGCVCTVQGFAPATIPSSTASRGLERLLRPRRGNPVIRRAEKPRHIMVGCPRPWMH